MTDLRTGVGSALEALDCPGKAKTADEQAAITALRTALAEPDYWQEEARRYAGNADYWRKRYETLAEPQQHPVAWRTFDGEGGYDYRSYDDNEDYHQEYVKRNGTKYAHWVEPLYTTPTSCPNCRSLEAQNTELDSRLAILERAHGDYAE